VLPLFNHKSQLITKDLLVENRHFKTHYVDAVSLAHKALQVNLSDIAAMGGKPTYILCGIAIPERLAQYATNFLNALTSACKNANVILIGGDTTAADNTLCISITAIGEAQNHHIKYRTQAKPQQLLCHLGNLGFAHLGLTAFERNTPALNTFKHAFLYPTARCKAGAWLAQHSDVTSMMDVSDGLYIDLSRLCKASGVGATLYCHQLPHDDLFLKACETLQLDPLKTLLTGGEDYGLLFTVNAHAAQPLSNTFLKQFHHPIHCIGEITQDTNITLYDHDTLITPTLTPFTHFGETE
jgi:thiamine-monophosphate kinase